MKRYVLLVVITILGIVITSCSTPHQITIHGTPGHYISYEPTMEDGALLGSIDRSGKAVIEVDDQMFYPCLFSIDPQTRRAIPFGLDFTDNSPRSLCAVSPYLALAGVFGGAFTSLIGLAVSESIATTGLFTMLGSVSFLLPPVMSDNAARSNYKYLPTQNTNDDLAR